MNAEKFKFRTEVSIPKSRISISHKSKIILAGSCFADAIGEKMEFNKFPCLTNPFGNIYNPISLFSSLRHSMENTLPEDWTYITNQGKWLNFLLHSEVFDTTKEGLAEKIQQLITAVGEFLKEADFLILTLGTSWIYKFNANGHTVANCHKTPARNFEKHLLSPKEIIDEFELLRKRLQERVPNLHVIFTISPVRHIKDTIPLNNLSKSVLRTAIHYINESFPETSYFPSYEIMMDDLRDYRFYKKDLIHPTELAEDYIWEKFSESYFDAETLMFISDWSEVSKAVRHRAFNPESEEHQQFLKATLKKLRLLEVKANFNEEVRMLEAQIIKLA